MAGIGPRPAGQVNLAPLLPSSWGAISCTAAGVNSSGQIDGTYYTAASGEGIAGAFVYTIGGSAEQINLPSNIAAGVEGVGNINESGSVALYSAAVPGVPPAVPASTAVFNANTEAVTYPGGAGSSGTGYRGFARALSTRTAGSRGLTKTIPRPTPRSGTGARGTLSHRMGQGRTTAYGIDSNGDIVGKETHEGYYAILLPVQQRHGHLGRRDRPLQREHAGRGHGINDNQVIVGWNQTAGCRRDLEHPDDRVRRRAVHPGDAVFLKYLDARGGDGH